MDIKEIVKGNEVRFLRYRQGNAYILCPSRNEYFTVAIVQKVLRPPPAWNQK
jgi:hypothetical protein